MQKPDDFILVTGGAGFVGSALIRQWLKTEPESIVNLDKLTYAANIKSLDEVSNLSRYVFIKGDICCRKTVAGILEKYQPIAIVHLAAESHVDRSIDGPLVFVQTNVLGTSVLLDCALEYWQNLPSGRQTDFRFLHVSTDEVYGSAPPNVTFDEQSPYAPNSPYAASKAGSDHFVRAYQKTYGLPTLMTHCGNNYGIRQFPEKLIPLMIYKALAGESLPVYGDGQQVREWISRR